MHTRFTSSPGLSAAVDVCFQTIWNTESLVANALAAAPLSAALPANTEASGTAPSFAPADLTAYAHGLFRRLTQLPGHIGIHASVEPALVTDMGFADIVTATQTTYNVDPRRLNLEIEGGSTSTDLDAVATATDALRRTGARIGFLAMTAATPVDRLADLPLSSLTIGEPLTTAEHTPAVARDLGAIIGLAAFMHCSVIAAGVATTEQLERVRDLGCGQGRGRHVHDYEPFLSAEAQLPREPLHTARAERFSARAG